MLAHAPDYPPSYAPTPEAPRADPPSHRRRDGRLFIGRFLVPDHPFFLPVPCPSCGGPAYHDDGDLRCLLCSKDLLVAAISPTGRITELTLKRPSRPTLVRIAPGQTRRTARALSRADGITGLQARVLRLVPRGEDEYTVVETLVNALAVRRAEVRAALEALAEAGLVERFPFAGGYRVGWRRSPVH